MNFPASALASSVERGLQIKATKLNRISAVRWSLQFSSGARHRLEVQHEGEWLRFSNDLDPVAGPSTVGKLWDAVRKNAALPAELSLTLGPARTLELRSDVLVTDDTDRVNRVRGVVKMFESAWKNDAPVAVTPLNENLDDLERLCEESGWRGVRRSSGRLTVALDVTPPLQAIVVSIGNSVRVCVEVADLASGSSPNRMAMAALALELTSRARLVRASADTDSGKLLFEVWWASPPSTEELHAGFGSLSAALRAAGESFAALQNEQLAKDYLTVRGWTADTSHPNQQPERTNT